MARKCLEKHLQAKYMVVGKDFGITKCMEMLGLKVPGKLLLAVMTLFLLMGQNMDLRKA